MDKEYTLKPDNLPTCSTCKNEITIHPIKVGNFIVATASICSWKCERCREELRLLFNRGIDCLGHNFGEHLQGECQCVSHKRCEQCGTYVEKKNVDHRCSKHVNSFGEVEHTIR
jgi:hypothetical protein